jgi:CBS domain-containing protein
MDETRRRTVSMKIRDVMSTSVITTTPDAPLKEAALHLAREGISGIPVVDEAGAVVGVLSEAGCRRRRSVTR